METIVGQVIDNYKIIEVIGRGGMGVVFKALDLNLEKTVALKMIDPFVAQDENFLKRFKTEAKALARLDNRNIVNVYALRETEHGLFMVMEYVPALTISEWLREKSRFSVKETIDITSQILNAIEHAHKIGVIHRDIKPNNILLREDGNVKVMDFGLAKVAQDHGSQATVTHTAAGTLYYMSPEQIKGLKNVDKRSDIYSIGMTIYEMLAGRVPFEKTDSEFSIQKQIVDGEIPSPLQYNPNIPRELVKFVIKAIDKNPEKRFQNIAEMKTALAGIKYTGNRDVTKVISNYDVKPETDYEGIKKSGKNKKLLIGVSAAAVAVILLFSFIFLSQDRNGEENISTNNDRTSEATPGIKKAKLNIISDPSGATVLLNNRVMGVTPLILDSLDISSYSIVLKLDGYEGWSNNDFSLKGGDNTISETLNQIPAAANSTLNLSMDVPGKIFLDGRGYSVDANQVLTRNLPSGGYKLRFVSENNANKQINVDLREESSKKIKCYFKRQVNVQSLNEAGDSFWGNIFINGNNTGIPTPGTITLEAGTHNITVKKTGYVTVENEQSVTISPSFNEEAPINLVFHLK